jgi:hypothetical protein
MKIYILKLGLNRLEIHTLKLILLLLVQYEASCISSIDIKVLNRNILLKFGQYLELITK